MEQFVKAFADRRRLSHIVATTSNGRKMMDNTYSYDKVNNILSLVNEAPQVTPNRKGGPFEYTYQYDDLYRLTHAEGDWKGATHEHRYELDMQYSPTGRILHKTQTHDRMSYDEPGTWVPQHKTTYDWEYRYEGPQPHAATHIGENTYTYDANGNQTGWTSDKNNQSRQILWDSLSRFGGKENRMRAIADNGTTHHYIYDAAGERVIKSTGDGQAIYVNGFPMGGSGTVGNYTVYVNPFMVFQNFKYTKHFYIEGQRIVSKLGEMGIEQPMLLPKSHAGDSTKNPIQWDNKKDLTKDIIIANFEALGLNGAVFTAGKSGKMPYGQIKKYFRGNDVVINPGTPSTTTTGKRTEDLQFYYHPDHLGSSNYITDASGEVYQHQEYFPFGETFVEERNDAEYTTYLFNGKELDEETGLYYYGARYYDARISMWYGVDPFAEKALGWTPYRFGFNNPLRYFDPDGQWEWDETGNLVAQKGDQSYSLARFLGTSQKNAMTILNRGGVTANDKGILNLKEGQTFAKSDLWVGFKSGSGPVVNNTSKAKDHYFNGNGKAADVGDNSTAQLLTSDKFQAKHTKITSQEVAPKGYFSIDMTDKEGSFHIGNTGVDYSVNGNGKSSSVTYTLFTNTNKNSSNFSDGFWDPNFAAERTFGKLGINRYKADEMGPNLEWGKGQPYPYKTRERTYFFKPIGQ